MSEKATDPSSPWMHLPGKEKQAMKTSASHSRVSQSSRSSQDRRDDFFTLCVCAMSMVFMALLFFQVNLEQPGELLTPLFNRSRPIAEALGFKHPLPWFLLSTTAFLLAATACFLVVADATGSAGVLFICNAGSALFGARFGATATEVLFLFLPSITTVTLAVLHLLHSFRTDI